MLILIANPGGERVLLNVEALDASSRDAVILY